MMYFRLGRVHTCVATLMNMFVILPKRIAMYGNEAPLTKDARNPTTMRAMSPPVAYLNY